MGPSLQEIKDRAVKLPLKISLAILDLEYEEEPYEQFVSLINKALDYIAQELARNPELRQHSEDEITVQIISLLKTMTFDAAHDTKIGGHSDIVIEALDDLLWLGEAKKIEGTNNTWLYKGFKQLSTRYATGLDRQNKGGILLYCFMEDLKGVMKKWEEYVLEAVDGIQTRECDENSFAFISTHTLERTGTEYTIRHLPVSLYFEPDD